MAYAMRRAIAARSKRRAATARTTATSTEARTEAARTQARTSAARDQAQAKRGARAKSARKGSGMAAIIGGKKYGVKFKNKKKSRLIGFFKGRSPYGMSKGSGLSRLMNKLGKKKKGMF